MCEYVDDKLDGCYLRTADEWNENIGLMNFSMIARTNTKVGLRMDAVFSFKICTRELGCRKCLHTIVSTRSWKGMLLGCILVLRLTKGAGSKKKKKRTVVF